MMKQKGNCIKRACFIGSVVFTVLGIVSFLGCGGGSGGGDDSTPDPNPVPIVDSPPDLTPGVQTGTVSGTVYVTGTADPVSGVLVQISSITYTTDNSGEYALNDVPTGNQTITTFKSDFEGTSETINVQQGQNNHDCYITSSILTGVVRGNVEYSNGDPVYGARVTIGDMEDTTDSTGLYQFPTVPQGNITITVTHPEPVCDDILHKANIYLSSADRIYNMELEHCYFDDTYTNLMWQRTFSHLSVNDSNAFCGNLKIEGYSDWRLPSIEELITIIDFENEPPIDTSVFLIDFVGDPGNLYSKYWSSTIRHNQSTYWTVNFGNGVVWFDLPAWDSGCRCVRGASLPVADFTDNGDGTITDHTTGLMWEDFSLNYTSFNGAAGHCDGLFLGGYSDWRIPTIRELVTIIDYGTSYPAIDTDYFSNAWGSAKFDFWSSTQGSSLDKYWEADLSIGQIKQLKTSERAFSICVRDQ